MTRNWAWLMAVRVQSDRCYRFGADPAELWAAFSKVENFPNCWPWLRDFDGRELAIGQRWSCTVQPPLPYSVKFVVEIDDLEAGRFVSSTVSGDIEGRARLEVGPHPVGSEARLVSDLQPAQPVLRLMGMAASPLARWAHNWVLSSGARQFRNYSFGVDETV